MRFFALALVLGASCSALASFDLMLVRDAGKIHRIDPVSGAYLGNFQLTTSSSVMAASSARKSLYMVSGATVGAVDYSTGDYRLIGTSLGFTPSAMAMSRNEATLYVASNNGNVAQLDATTLIRGADITLEPATTRIHSLYVTVGGLFLATIRNASGHYLRSYSSSGSMISSINIDSNTLETYTNGITVNQNQIFYGRTSNSYGGAILDPLLGTLSSGFTNNVPLFSSLVGMHDGHIGSYWTGLDSTPANGFKVQYINPFQNWDRTFTYSQITAPLSTALVLAPEPTSLAALALGGLALIRRRRQGK